MAGAAIFPCSERRLFLELIATPLGSRMMGQEINSMWEFCCCSMERMMESCWKSFCPM